MDMDMWLKIGSARPGIGFLGLGWGALQNFDSSSAFRSIRGSGSVKARKNPTRCWIWGPRSGHLRTRLWKFTA